MAVNRLRTPDHINARTIACTHDGRHLDHLAIAGQRFGRPHLHNGRHIGPVRIASPSRDLHVGQIARDRLHTRRHTQIAAGQHRCLPHVTQLLGCGQLDDLQRAAEVLICGHKGRANHVCVGIRSRSAVAARPDTQTRRIRGRHQHHAICNRLVHVIPFLCAWARPKTGPFAKGCLRFSVKAALDLRHGPRCAQASGGHVRRRDQLYARNAPLSANVFHRIVQHMQTAFLICNDHLLPQRAINGA